MAKTTKAAAAKATAVKATADEDLTSQVMQVTETTSEPDILRMDGMAGVRLEFDVVHFRPLSDAFVATLKPENQKAYWLAFAEFNDRVRRSNLALHEIGVDPVQKILDGPRGKANPLVRDKEKVEKLLGRGWYVTWRVAGGEGDFESALSVGFKAVRRPKDKEEEAAKPPLEWSGELWKVPDGTVDRTSGEAIYNVMVVIQQKRWDDNLKAMSMASHNLYRQNKQQFIEGAENISRDMLGGKEKVLPPDGGFDLDEMRSEEHTEVRGGKRVRV